MIISPTIESGLNLNSYTLRLPDVAINIEAPKTVSARRTLGGTASISAWAGSIDGQIREPVLNLIERDYVALKRLLDTNAEKWVLRIFGKVFEVILDITSATPLNRLESAKAVTIRIVFVRELSK